MFFSEFAGFKIFVITVKGLEPVPSHPLCWRPTCYHNTNKTHVRDMVFKLSLIQTSVIIRFPEFTEFSESYAPFKKNSIESNSLSQCENKHIQCKEIRFEAHFDGAS